MMPLSHTEGDLVGMPFQFPLSSDLQNSSCCENGKALVYIYHPANLHIAASQGSSVF